MQNRILAGFTKVILPIFLLLVFISCAQPAQKEGVWYTQDGQPYTPAIATDYFPKVEPEEVTNIIDTAIDMDGRMHIVGDSCYNNPSVWGYFEGNALKGTYGQTSQFDDLSNLRTPVEMIDPLIEIDASNHPHILFINNERLCHCYIEGHRWFSTDGELITEESDASKCYITDYKVSDITIKYDMALDSYGNPHITFTFTHDKITYVAYIHWDGSDWVGIDNAVIDENSDDWLSEDELFEYAKVSSYDETYRNPRQVDCPELEIDSNDQPHIVWLQYFDSEMGKVGIVYKYWENDRWNSVSNEDGSPYVVTVNPYDAGKYINEIDLELDNNDTPHIIYDDMDVGLIGIRYLTLKDNTWKGIYGEEHPDNLVFSYEKIYKLSRVSFEVDNQNLPHFMWCAEPRDIDCFLVADAYYCRYNGDYLLTLFGTINRLSSSGHPITTNVTQSLNVKEASMSLDKDGNPHLVVVTTDGLKYLHGKPANRWEKTWEEMEQEHLKEE